MYRQIITEINISNNRKYSDVNNYVNKYCSDSLKVLTIKSNDLDATEVWKKPFTQLTKIYVDTKFVNCEKTDFNVLSNISAI